MKFNINHIQATFDDKNKIQTIIDSQSLITPLQIMHRAATGLQLVPSNSHNHRSIKDVWHILGALRLWTLKNPERYTSRDRSSSRLDL
ncbi:hypothetical protein TNCT_428231 [Trichonephila clavata]|uniref:Uncharacterized protein n=1 Tax=Trichonephila clavata TaxID=2740835 RepID=A0A8X6GG96_TRICU|nr:hypothetical protein TNCT_428231 [Trichonephila clavata]